MGDLIAMDEFDPHYQWGGGSNPIPGTRKRDPTWYFIEFEYEGNNRYRPVVESSFPERIAIHWDHLMPERESYKPEINRLKTEIRRYVRDQLSGDVVFTSIDKSYAYIGRYQAIERDRWRHKDGMKPYRTKVRHGYFVFHFESAADAVKFGLAFGTFISDVEERHPRQYSDVTEEQIREAAENPFGVYGED